MTRTVDPVLTLKIPTGQRIGVRHFVTERAGNPDSPGSMLAASNSLYELLKQPLLEDAWAEPLVSGAAAGVYDQVAEWMLPCDHTLSGPAMDGEGLILQVRTRTLNGDTGRVRATVGGVDYDSGDLSSPTWGWVTLPTAVVDDSADVNLKLSARATANGANIHIDAVLGLWDTSRSVLPDGPAFLNGVEPLDTARLTAELSGLSVRSIRQLLANLTRIRQRRVPGMIGTKAWYERAAYSTAYVVDLEGGGTTVRQGGWRGAFRGLTRQRRDVRRARVWVRGRTTPGAPAYAFATFRTEAGLVASQQFATDATTATWYVADVELPAYSGQRPLPVEVALVLPEDANAMSVHGVCAWWLPIGT